GVLAPFCWREVLARRAVLLRSWRILLLLSVMSTGLYSALTYWSLHYTTATNTTLLNSTIPIWVMVASWILLKHLPPARALLGFLISLAGVLFIVAHGHPGTLFTLAPNVGDLIMLLALFLWGFYAVLLRYRPAELSPLGYVFVTGVVGTVIATPVFLLDNALSVVAGARRDRLFRAVFKPRRDALLQQRRRSRRAGAREPVHPSGAAVR